LALGLAAAAAARTERVRWVDPNALDPDAPPVAGFRIYLGADPGVYDSAIDVGVPRRDLGGVVPVYSHKIHLERPGTIYLAVTAYDAQGRESAFSNERARLDSDLDGIPDGNGRGEPPCAPGETLDCRDNCPHAPNPLQEDAGGVGPTSTPDGIGDACQCGDVDGNGRVTVADAFSILQALRDPPGPSPPNLDLCDVGGAAACTTDDAVAIWRAQFAGGWPLRQRCAPALSAGG
jgi:hypothetical protein